MAPPAPTPADTRGPIQRHGRKGRGPVAIVDIGSNSVRLVIYEDFARSAKSWIRDLRFSPARIGTCLVSQAALRPLRFEAPGRR